MTVKLAENVIQLTQTPVRCSSCFGQNTSIKHIDMDAACDRGYGNDEAVKIAYDDLVLCENCVREAAALLNMVDRDDKALDRLEKELSDERARSKQAEKWARTMEDAIGAKPNPPQIDHRKRPRPLRTVDQPPEVVA